MVKQALSLLSSISGGWTTKVLLVVVFALLGLWISAVVGLKHYEKQAQENLAQKLEISAQFNQTRVLIEKQNEAIQKAHAELGKYQQEIANIKKATAKEFADLKNKRIQSCADFSTSIAELLQTYEQSRTITAKE